MSYSSTSVLLPPPPIQRKSWFARNWKWFIPTVVLTPLAFVALMFGVLVSLFSGVMKSNEPYQHALSVASQDARVVHELGAPVKPGWYVTGSINTTPTSGDADLAFPLKGNIHQGTVYVVAKKSAGIWSYQRLEIEIDGQPNRINLLAPPTPSEEK